MGILMKVGNKVSEDLRKSITKDTKVIDLYNTYNKYKGDN